ncbi:DUF3631 domain-containing protein [soil metagenome]
MTALDHLTPADAGTAGVTLLDEVETFLATFVAFPTDGARVAVTLWAAHAHLVHDVDSSPRLALLSPEPGSGKTRTLEVLELLVPAPMSVLSASVAAIFRTLASGSTTLLFDEADAIFGRRGSDDGAEDLRALLNAGHRRGQTIPRCVGPKHEVVRFPVYTAVALAGLGALPDTLMSRSVIIRMRRRAPGEHVTPYRHRVHAPAGNALRDRLAEWAAAVGPIVGDAWPDFPTGVEDRPADVWEPLLALADAAGGRWPDRARAACIELVKVAASRDASLGVRLLGDLRQVFGDADVLSTEELLKSLHGLDEAPWNDLRGKPMDARGLARRLRQYGVTSQTVRVGDATPKGYRRTDLHDPWTRYLPPVNGDAVPHPPESATSATTDTPQVMALTDVAETEEGGATTPAVRHNGQAADQPSGGRGGCGAPPGGGRTDVHIPDLQPDDVLVRDAAGRVLGRAPR